MSFVWPIWSVVFLVCGRLWPYFNGLLTKFEYRINSISSFKFAYMYSNIDWLVDWILTTESGAWTKRKSGLRESKIRWAEARRTERRMGLQKWDSALSGYLWPPCGFFFFLMVALCNRPLYFCPVISIFFLFSFFPSPNLSDLRLDVYHTSTHGVALVRILNACMKCAARGLLKYRTQKSPFWHHRQICRAVSSQLRHVSTIGKTC